MSLSNSRLDEQPTALSPNIFLFPPDRQASADSLAASQNQPTLVILCTWLGAATTRRVGKYSTAYREMYPGATILVIRTVIMDLTVRSFAAVRARLTPAREAINALLGNGQSSALLHIFSHGGCNTALQLVASMDADEREAMQRSLRLVVFDCCPGDASLGKAYEAALLSLPPQMPLRSTLGSAAVYAFIACIHGLQTAGLMLSVTDMRRELNDPSVFGSGAHRLYLFSEGDRAVDPEDVVSHAQQGERAGFSVRTSRFSGAPHCSLLMEDAARYWGLIDRHWREAAPREELSARRVPLPKL